MPPALPSSHVTQNIFRHFSQIFSPKLSNDRDADALENHAKLITAVLTVIRKAVLEASKKFKPETWEEVRHRFIDPLDRETFPRALPSLRSVLTRSGSSSASSSVPRT